jgi:hypothetical protein
MMGIIRSNSCGENRESIRGVRRFAAALARLLRNAVRRKHEPVLVPREVFEGDAAVVELDNSLGGLGLSDCAGPAGDRAGGRTLICELMGE